MSGTDLHVPETMHIESQPAEQPQAPPPPPAVQQQPAAPPPPERPRSRREIALAEIYENRQRALSGELAAGLAAENEARMQGGGQPREMESPEDEEARAEREEREAEETRHRLEREASGQARREATQQEQSQPQQPRSPEPAPALHTINVDGMQVQVTPEQLQHLATLGAITNREMARARQQPQQPQYYPQPQPQFRQPPPQPRQQPAEILSAQEAEEFAQRIQYGDKTESAKAIQDLLHTAISRAPQPQQIDVNGIVSAAVQQSLHQNQHMRNLEILGTEYGDIFSDTRLSRLAALELADIRAEDTAAGRFMSDLDAYRESCRRIRESFVTRPTTQPTGHQSGHQASQAGVRVGDLEAREQRKRAAPQTPQAADRKQAIAAPEPRPLSGAEIVAQMRRARGQPAY